ncbi:neuropeptide Y receptor type 5 [Biomphalaria glabrata]|uniref:Neuropeptide Y receptor type 5-like n=1 Tax=Biomphalaria glabrata TaxID=6526 RepID=A0A9U8EJ32_BIOGL|nr:neuropeptide Y receptor type 5-like [Biomphalaria glabrata]XP_055872238.1 neuropeptide Y receptor type 5-like [Biomphalaria glabrata]
MFMSFDFVYVNTDSLAPMTTVLPPNHTFISSDILDEDRRIYLDSLQGDTNIRNIPTFIFLVAMAMVGLFGNSLILLIYSGRKKKTSTIVFIQSIAVVDLITNVIVIPLTIYVLFHTWDFNNHGLCKSFLFINLAAASTSAILLLAVATVRYRKVCIPLGWQVTANHARIISVVIAVFSCLTSIPYTVVHGIQLVETGRPEVRGKECRVDQNYVNTIWPLVVSLVSLVIFLSCCIPLTYMYVRVGITAWRHIYALDVSQADDAKMPQNTSDDTMDTKDSASDVQTKTDCIELELKDKPNEGVKKDVTSSQQTICVPPARGNLEAIGRKIANHTTRMLITISVVYIITNLTTLILVFIRSLKPEQMLNIGTVADSMYRLFLQIFMLNCAINPFIYCMCDRKFRKEATAFLRKVFCPQCQLKRNCGVNRK